MFRRRWCGVGIGPPSGRNGRGGGDLSGEPFDFRLQAAHFFERAFGEDGKFPGLAGQKFAAQCAQRLVHALQLFHRLGQDGFGFHKLTRKMPFRTPGLSRTRLKKSKQVLQSWLSCSAINTSNANRRRSIARETRAYSDMGKSRSKSCPGRSTATRSMSLGADLPVTKLPSTNSALNRPLRCIAPHNSSNRANKRRRWSLI